MSWCLIEGKCVNEYLCLRADCNDCGFNRSVHEERMELLEKYGLEPDLRGLRRLKLREEESMR